MSGQQSSAFYLLDERIQRFIWGEGWETLRDAQEAAIPLIVGADRDVIIAAATAAGKTEAAFLPGLTSLLQREEPGLIVYISPLKALINDQFGRLDRLCEQLEIPVWPWHGDISPSLKSRFMSSRQGVLLITPESLEATLCNRGTAVGRIFDRLTFFVVDELHAFIGTERGRQLQSLMHRIERVVGRTVPRIGLSATLGDMSLAAEFLRPGHGKAVTVVDSKSTDANLQVLLKGYEEPLVVRPEGPSDEEPPDPVTPAQIAAHLFKSLRGSNNLVFPNSRGMVERYTNLLDKMCEAQQVPREFWPHHGSLSKEIRAETEAALKQRERPATAVCTNTLELGIDIGAVRSVAQIGPPPSVASLRQRLGRSGRRKGEPAVLRGYTEECAIGGKSALYDELRLDTVEFVAAILLLVDGWFEPPRVGGMHTSTLVQQLMSVIAQCGGATMGQLYSLLCGADAPFSTTSKVDFSELVRHLGAKDLVMQDSSGLLLHGQLGEKFVNHYTFYTAFATEEEFRIVTGTRTLGTLPLANMLAIGQFIMFAGKTWRIEEVDDARKVILVSRASGGKPPMFAPRSGRTHTRVRQRMRQLLEQAEHQAFLDPTARRFLDEARATYASAGLTSRYLIDQGTDALVLTWLGDSANEALACLLQRRGFDVAVAGPGLMVRKRRPDMEDIVDALYDAGVDETPPLDVLLEKAHNLDREKWDWTLPLSLLQRSYASLYLDIEEALQWVRVTVVKPLQPLGSAFDDALPQAHGAQGPMSRGQSGT